MSYRFLPLLALLAAWSLSGCAPSSTAEVAQGADSSSMKSTGSTNESGAGSAEGSSAPAPKPAAPAPQTSSGPGVPVETYTVRARTVEDAIVSTGELRADEEVDLRSEEDGRIVKLGFREGQAVAKGDLLVKINDADLVAERRRLAVQRDLAIRREERTQALLEEQTLSQEVYDEARGRLQVLEAQLDQIDAQLAKTEIRAPFSGVVGLREVSEGSYITSSDTIARLQSLDPIKLDFAVPEKYAGDIRAGDTVEFTVTGNERTFEGRVYAVEPRIDVATRTVRVRARAKNPDRNLLPGAFARVRLVLDTRDDALMIPSIALIPGDGATTVFVVEDGKAAPRAVTTGKRTEDRVQIRTGLEAGDQVIVAGIQQVRPGTEVDAREQEIRP